MDTHYYSDYCYLDMVGDEAAAEKLASLPSSAKRVRGNRAGTKKGIAIHVKTTDAQKEALVRKVESACIVAGKMAVEREIAKEKNFN